MAIADTISSMYENVGEVYDTITNVDVNNGKNLLKYPYLNTTSTISGVTFTDNGNGSITINGTSTSSTYSLWFLYENAWSYAGLSFELEPGTYTFKALGTDKVSMPVNIYFSDNTHEYFAIYNDDVTKTITEKVRLNMRLLVNGGVSVNNVTIYPQINKGNTALPYQPYTDNPTYKNIENIPKVIRKSYLNIMNNGYQDIYDNWEKVEGTGETLTLNSTEEAPMKINLKGNTSQGDLPNPNYPQDIHVVSGDNTINVCGKNLFNPNDLVNGVFINVTTGEETSNRVWTQTKLIGIGNASSVTSSNSVLPDASNRFEMSQYDENKNWIKSAQYGNINASSTVNLEANTRYIRFGYRNDKGFTDIQLEKGSTATEYEEYKGNTYNIDLPVENLINPSLFTIGGSHNVSSISNGEVVGTSITGYAGVRIALGQNVNLKTNDVIYVRLKIKSDVAGDIFSTIQLFNSSNTIITATSTKLLTPTLTTEYQEYIMKFALGTDDILNKLFIQHKGSTSNVFTIKDIQVSYANGSYTPYGTTPIELCKIGTYQDSIKKSTGKNLFNGETELGAYDNNGNKSFNNNCRRTIDFIEVKPSTTYIFSRNGSTFNCKYFYYDKNKNYISSQVLNSSFTTPDNCYYLNFFSDQLVSDYANLMLNEGSTALPYEPYGTSWYLNKQIGKVVLDGSENWNDQGNGGYATNVSDKYSRYGTDGLICNYFHLRTGTSTSNYFGIDNDTTRIRFWNVGQTLANFKTWLSNNNTIVYYALATPTYTQITDTTLINQLEALNGAKSYTTQTNINQDNNDKPFILDATALKQLTAEEI